MDGLDGGKKGADEIGGGFDGGVGKRLDFDGVSAQKRGFSETGGDADCGVCERWGFDGERLDFDGGVSERLKIDGGVGEKLDFVGENSGGFSEKKKGVDGIGGGLDGGVCEGVDFDCSNSGGLNGKNKGVDGIGGCLDGRVCENLDYDGLNLGALSGKRRVVDEIEGGLDGGVCEKSDLAGGVCEELDFETSNAGNLTGRKRGIDECGGEVDQVAGESAAGGSRYTGVDKGKGKEIQPSISSDEELELVQHLEYFMNSDPAPDLQPPEIFQQNEVGVRELDYLNQQQDAVLGFQREQDYREPEVRNEELARIVEDDIQWLEDRKRARRQFALRFARPSGEDWDGESSASNPNVPSTARNMKQSDHPLIRWKPLENDDNIPRRFVPSLLDLSLTVLASNADMILSLKGVPDTLKKRLCNLVCDSRKMNARVLDLFIRDSPEEIRVKDASWITGDQFKKSFGSFNFKNLKVFQFDLCGRCISDEVIAATLARPLSSLPGLGIISLRGACHLSDEALKVLVTLAPGLCSINLGECSLLTHIGINYIADVLGNCLRELMIDYCYRIDAKDLVSALKKFKYLEVLSVAGIPNLCDGILTDIITASGRNIRDLDLTDCERLTDSSLKIIGQTCSDLRALNIVNLQNLTDVGLSYLANGCQSIRSLKLGRNKFSDEAIAKFIEIAGRLLEELSLNHVSQQLHPIQRWP
nr:PREDICTED: uncharacterized protein LOC108212416 isoform X2 [Daucus carota subsp. sativus]